MPPRVLQASPAQRGNQEAASSAHAAADAKASSLEAANRIQAASAHAAADAKPSSLAAAQQITAINTGRSSQIVVQQTETLTIESIASSNGFTALLVNTGDSLPTSSATSTSFLAESTLLITTTSSTRTVVPSSTSSVLTDATSVATLSFVLTTHFLMSLPSTTTLLASSETVDPRTVTVISTTTGITQPPTVQTSLQAPATLGLEISLPIISFITLLLLVFVVWKRKQKATVDHDAQISGARISNAWPQASASISIKELEGFTCWEERTKVLGRNRELGSDSWRRKLEGDWEPAEMAS